MRLQLIAAVSALTLAAVSADARLRARVQLADARRG
jgi:hypothetical protein